MATATKEPVESWRRVQNPALDRRGRVAAERRRPTTLWQRLKRWMDERWQNWKHYLRAGMEATGIFMGIYQFFQAFGLRTLMWIVGIGMILAPVTSI